MKSELKGSVNMNLKRGETVKLKKSPYVPQSVNNILIVSRLALKGATKGDTQEKTTIKKNGVNIILDSIKGKK